MNSEEEENAFRDHSSIRYFSLDANKVKSFEYELALCYPDLELLITESMSNQSEIINLMVGDYAQSKVNV